MLSDLLVLFFLFVNLFEWIGKKDYVMWVEFVIYFILFGKTTHFNLRRDEWDDVQKAYQIIFFLVYGLCWKRFRKACFMCKTWEENESKSESGNSIVFLLFPLFFKSVGYGLRIKPFYLHRFFFIYLIFKGDFHSSIF